MAKMKMELLKKHLSKIIWFVVLLAVGIGATMTHEQWMPYAKKFVAFIQNKKTTEEPTDEESAVGGTPDTITLSPTAWKNLGLVTGPIGLSDFVKVVSVPAIVVERPGRSQTEITAPMTGVVTEVYPLEREVVQPGVPLFELRLTHEDVVSAQSDFLTRLQNLDVVNQELARLQNIGTGIIPGKRIVEQEYERDRAMANLEALRQSLLLHGLSEQQISTIEQTRNVLRKVTVVAPPFAKNHDDDHAELERQYHVQSINVNRGESVTSGKLMGVLADHCLLYVEGQAFEDDARRLTVASRNGTTVKVVPVSGETGLEDRLDLPVQSISDQVDHQSRALKFYLLLRNSMAAAESESVSSGRFVTWKYRPGQRMEVLIPTTNRLINKIVLPANAVAIDGPNAFVFEQNGDNFDRIDVHILYRDKSSVVIENDGKLIGSVIALNGAFEMHQALKNQSGGAIDPHAGHNH